MQRANYIKHGLHREVDIVGTFWPNTAGVINNALNRDSVGKFTDAFSATRANIGRYAIALTDRVVTAGAPICSIGVAAADATKQPLQIKSFAISATGVVTFEIEHLTGGALADVVANAAAWIRFAITVTYTTAN